MDKRAVSAGIIKRKHLLQMRPGRSKPASEHQVSPGRVVTQKEPGGIVALTAQTQQILVQALRYVEFAAERVIARLSIGNVKELRGRTQLLPKLSCACIGLACFRCGVALHSKQGRSLRTAQFEIL